ncbi:MAG: PDZ domain-containing protein [Polyangiaceae bacterium]
MLNACGGLGSALSGAASEPSGAEGSIGVKLGQKSEDRALYVRHVREGFPAAEAGLAEGDEILMIDGIYAKSMTASEVTKHLHGPIGSTVALTIARGQRILHIGVKRAVMTSEAEEASEKEKQLEE